MKKISATILYFFSVFFSAQSQVAKLIFMDSVSRVPFVCLYDTIQKKSFAANQYGIIFVEAKRYNFNISHVSYEENKIIIPLFEKDTTIIVYLTKKPVEMQEVIVKANKSNIPFKIIEQGYYSQKTPSSCRFPPKSKVGCLFKLKDTSQVFFLNTILFKLKNINAKNCKNCLLEVKIFDIKNDMPSIETINRKPIYIPFENLKKHNKISISELLPISEGSDLFVSFEIPPTYEDIDVPLIEFVSKWNLDTCEMFFTSNNSSNWGNKRLLSCRSDYFNGKKQSLNVSIIYSNKSSEK